MASGFNSSKEFIRITRRMKNSAFLCDAKIIIVEKSCTISYNVHRAILAVNSKFFDVWFQWAPDNLEYHLKGGHVTKEGFEQILSWIYCHKIDIGLDNVLQVLYEANYIQCKEVMDQCLEFIKKKLTSFAHSNIKEVAGKFFNPHLENMLTDIFGKDGIFTEK